MKKKSKFIFVLIVGALIFSCSYNIYQHNKISRYKEKLTYRIRNNVQKFASYGGHIEDETVYAERYASIVSAHESYVALSDNKGIPYDKWDFSLPGLFIAIKDVMLNDKDKFKEVFEGTDDSKLMFKISDNFEDEDSINKVYKLLSN